MESKTSSEPVGQKVNDPLLLSTDSSKMPSSTVDHRELNYSIKSDADAAHHQHQTMPTQARNFMKIWFDPKPQIAELCQVSFWKDVTVEGVALGHILIAVIMLLNTCEAAYYTPNPTIIGIFAAFMIFSSCDGWGPMCGCLLNPAAVVSFYLSGRMSFVRALFRILFEFGGAAAGAMIGYSLVPYDKQDKVAALHANPSLTLTQASAVEGILTFNLCFVALCVTRSGKTTVLHTLTIGTCKATGLLCAGSYTGGIQNPAIAMGPAVASRDFTDHFAVYWLGPFIGAIFAAILFRAIEFVNQRNERLLQLQATQASTLPPHDTRTASRF